MERHARNGENSSDVLRNSEQPSSGVHSGSRASLHEGLADRGIRRQTNRVGAPEIVQSALGGHLKSVTVYSSASTNIGCRCDGRHSVEEEDGEIDVHFVACWAAPR